jgi:hypothetical protein
MSRRPSQGFQAIDVGGEQAFDDPLHGAVDLVAYREGFRDCYRQPAMQREHELVPLGDRGFDEALQRVAGCRAAAAAMVAMDTRGPSRYTAAVAARTRASWLHTPPGRGLLPRARSRWRHCRGGPVEPA